MSALHNEALFPQRLEEMGYSAARLYA